MICFNNLCSEKRVIEKMDFEYGIFVYFDYPWKYRELEPFFQVNIVFDWLYHDSIVKFHYKILHFI
jgi:hypothetical protein